MYFKFGDAEKWSVGDDVCYKVVVEGHRVRAEGVERWEGGGSFVKVYGGKVRRERPCFGRTACGPPR